VLQTGELAFQRLILMFLDFHSPVKRKAFFRNTCQLSIPAIKSGSYNCISTFWDVFLERRHWQDTEPAMNEQMILQELLGLLEGGGVSIRSEPLGGAGGGLCTVKGRPVFFVDTQAPSVTVAAMCAEALPKVVDIEQIYIKPQVRQFIEAYGNQTT
jgi:hypothetical protein